MLFKDRCYFLVKQDGGHVRPAVNDGGAGEDGRLGRRGNMGDNRSKSTGTCPNGQIPVIYYSSVMRRLLTVIVEPLAAAG